MCTITPIYFVASISWTFCNIRLVFFSYNDLYIQWLVNRRKCLWKYRRTIKHLALIITKNTKLQSPAVLLDNYESTPTLLEIEKKISKLSYFCPISVMASPTEISGPPPEVSFIHGNFSWTFLSKGERYNEVIPMWSTNPWDKARPQHREPRALLFSISAFVL